MKQGKDHDSDNEEEEVLTETTSEQPTAVARKVDTPQQLGFTPAEFAERQDSFNELHYRYQDDPEEGTVFEAKSETIVCPHCDTRADSLVDYKTNFLGYLMALILLLGLGWLSFCILPLVLSLTKTAVHRCSKCLNEVKNNSFLGFNSMEDKVLSFSIGTFGVALSRKYLLYAVLTIVCCCILYLILTTGMDGHYMPHITAITWSQYMRDCGSGAFADNRMKAFRAFDFHYS